MKSCGNCGQEVRQDSKFCGTCGASSAALNEAKPDRSIKDQIVGQLAAQVEREVAPFMPNAQAASGQQAPVPQGHASGFSSGLSALCLVLILALLSYSEYSKFKLAECKSEAIQDNFAHKVLDIRLREFKCEYLSTYVSGREPLEHPQWSSSWALTSD